MKIKYFKKLILNLLILFFINFIKNKNVNHNIHHFDHIKKKDKNLHLLKRHKNLKKIRNSSITPLLQNHNQKNFGVQNIEIIKKNKKELEKNKEENINNYEFKNHNSSNFTDEILDLDNFWKNINFDDLFSDEDFNNF